MKHNHLKSILFAAALLTVTAIQAGKYQNFKVSTYIRAQDVARMENDKFLQSTWETVSSQVDLDKIYIETHRDAYTVPEKTLLKVKNFISQNYMEEVRLAQLAEPVKIEEGYNMILTGKFEEGIKALKPYTDGKFAGWWPLWFYLGTAYRELAKASRAEFEAAGEGEAAEDEVTRGAYEEAAKHFKEVLKLAETYRDKLLLQWCNFKEGKTIRIIKIKK